MQKSENSIIRKFINSRVQKLKYSKIQIMSILNASSESSLESAT